MSGKFREIQWNGHNLRDNKLVAVFVLTKKRFSVGCNCCGAFTVLLDCKNVEIPTLQ